VFALERLGSVRSLMDMLRETPKRERAPMPAMARA
jgi:hypothetical protein